MGARVECGRASAQAGGIQMSTKGRFAVEAMVDLALRERAGPVVLATVARRLRLSPSYLEQLVAGLRAHGLVRATRGPGGGYTLGRPAGEISVADIVAAVESPAPAADGQRRRLDTSLWRQLEDTMRRHMAAISLASLLEASRARGAADMPQPAAPPLRRAFVPLPPRTVVAASVPNSVFALGRLAAA